jgi:hypothetical protein
MNLQGTRLDDDDPTTSYMLQVLEPSNCSAMIVLTQQYYARSNLNYHLIFLFLSYAQGHIWVESLFTLE